jgi:ParB-like nuclease domain.
MKVLEIREIEIDKIMVPDWARRTVMSEAELDDLKNSIREHGQIGPLSSGRGATVAMNWSQVQGASRY